MRDETPTQKFDPNGERPPHMGTPPGQDHDKRKSRRAIIILALIIGILLVALVALIFTLMKPNGSASPTETSTSPAPTSTSTTAAPTTEPTSSASPTTEPTSTATPTTEPTSEGASVDSFAITPNTALDCSSGQAEIVITWATSNAEAVYFGIDTDDASTGPFFSDLPFSGSSTSDFPSGYSPFYFSCPGSGNSHRYALTAVDSAGGKDTILIDITQP